MKKILLLLTLPLLLTACAYDTYHYPAGYNVHAAPAPRYYPNNNYISSLKPITPSLRTKNSITIMNTTSIMIMASTKVSTKTNTMTTINALSDVYPASRLYAMR